MASSANQTSGDAKIAARTVNRSGYQVDPTAGEVVHRADDVDLLVFDALAEDRRGDLQLLDVEDDVMLDGVVERVARLVEHGLGCAPAARAKCPEMARVRLAFAGSFDRGL